MSELIKIATNGQWSLVKSASDDPNSVHSSPDGYFPEKSLHPVTAKMHQAGQLHPKVAKLAANGATESQLRDEHTNDFFSNNPELGDILTSENSQLMDTINSDYESWLKTGNVGTYPRNTFQNEWTKQPLPPYQP